jgi:hypothetical protein
MTIDDEITLVARITADLFIAVAGSRHVQITSTDQALKLVEQCAVVATTIVEAAEKQCATRPRPDPPLVAPFL